MKTMISRISVLLFAVTLFLGTGCGENNTNTKVAAMKIVQGTDQMTLPGEEFAQEVIIELLSAPGTSIFGGESKPSPVEGKTVKVVPAPGSGLEILEPQLTSNAGGAVSFKVKAGSLIGDKYLTVVLEDDEEIRKEIRFIVGAKLQGGKQEGHAGKTTSNPLSLTLVGADGKPAVGVPVYFSVSDSPERKNSASVTPVVKTNAQGVAETDVKLGKSTGVYTIGVEVADPSSGYYIRNHKVRILGIDVVSVVLTLVGGLAFFLFGMKLMGDGLLKIAGENMKKILQFFSKRTTIAVLAGTVVTAIIQSSSATTVMVIGFINAGLLTLRQSIGLIFGANIGTTVTGQLVAFDLAALALPSVAIGFLVMLAKKRIIKGWGETILGFGLLFFGMTLMSSEMKLLGEFPSFVNLFQTFDCAPATPGETMPVGAVIGTILIAAIATFVIQSSSAAIGIIIALSAGGLINFYTAVPLLLGTNIGTTITAFLAALTANRVAKQAALAHMLFNCIGALIMFILFYIPYGPERIPCFLYFINWITPGDAFAAHPQNIERNIAMAHTFFNVFAVILLTPFAGTFTKLCEKLLPLREPVKIQELEPHLLKTPSIAIEQVVNVLRGMVQDAWKMVDQAVNEHFIKGDTNSEAFEELDKQEEKIDELQAELTNYLVRITRRPLTHHQSAIIPLLMHCTNDAERIADHTENILKLTKRLQKTGHKLSDVAVHDLNKLWSVLDAQANSVTLALASSSDKGNVHDALESEKKVNKLARKYEKNYTRKKDFSDLMADIDEEEFEVPVLNDEESIEVSTEALKNEREINQLARQYEKDHVKRRDAGKCAVESNVIFVEMLWELEKLGDHLANIAMRTPKIQEHYVEMN